MKKIKEVIIVEGKDDTKRIKDAVNADTLETRGSAIDAPTLALIKKIAAQRGIIIFTDPDFSGERIRKIVSKAVPDAKHAFIKRNQAKPTHSNGSLGVEHASAESIRDALANLYTENQAAKPLITDDVLIESGLVGGKDAKQRRQALCNILNIGYVNGKQLGKRLQMFSITPQQFKTAVEQIKEEL
ncbi:ribonuclease M5 [Nicoliella spurrieriana]|uniref:Ribonuclease M5 n=1 Tax=Nicoliella spurrieriana TaxID=2925830 RepID=A0A976RSQ2_9LACO|nr:ribonuclease M5 [Nicoliella spurrieriana]UQS87071.1 ribonuclease M5 [Nicoliella spurrieriana]